MSKTPDSAEKELIMATKHTYLAMIPTAVFSLALLTGCQPKDDYSSRGQDFIPPGVKSHVDRMNDAQAAKGAAVDGMLYDQHFDGNTLNSLGEKKLDYIVKGTCDDKPITIYLNMPHDDAQARAASINDYFKEEGLPAQAVQIVEGANPNLKTPAAYNLSEVYKEAGTSYDGSAADATAAAASAGGAAASTSK